MQSRSHQSSSGTAKGGAQTQSAVQQTAYAAASPLTLISGDLSSQGLQASQFSLPQAVVWQIKFIISGITSKKACAAATAELQLLADKFGTDFDKYLLKELIDQIELRDPNKAAKDKTESVKSFMLNQELSRASLKPEFLLYFEEIAQLTYGDRHSEFLSELTRRLKLATKMQLLVALSLAESCTQEAKQECFGLLKQKLIEFHASGKNESLEEYAVHRLGYIFSVYPEFQEDSQLVLAAPGSQAQQNAQALRDAKQFILDSNQFKSSQSVAMRLSLGNGDLVSCNPTQEDPSNSLVRVGSGLDHLSQASKFMEPWELLLDLGHYSSFNYQILTMAMTDFRDINEKTMANTILHLSLKHTGPDDMSSRIVFNTFEANKTGDPSVLRKEPSDKQTTMNWHAGHFSRAFRENYSNLNWLKVFEAFGNLSEGLDDNLVLDNKAYSTLMQIFSKSKPQNLQVPLSLILDRVWKCPSLQVSFIENVIEQYVNGQEKTLSFAKLSRRLPNLPDITLNDSEITNELIDVWQSPELVEILVQLSETNQYKRVRQVFDTPIRLLPEYLLLNLSKCTFTNGNILIDELFSILLPPFLTNHANSIPVLKKLWEYNQALMIRAMCELCRHEQRIMNLSRVLDITQEIKDSLIKIVYCQDYDFAVNLGILAGKRDFLHYDVWLKERIKGVGSPFIKALIRYINEQVIIPCREYMILNGYANQQQPMSQEDLEPLEKMKEVILERSHLSKERLCMTMEHLQIPINLDGSAAVQQQANEATGSAFSDNRISHEALQQIKDLVGQYTILFPSQVGPTQNTEEIESQANDCFQVIFSADPFEVDDRIQELIVTMQNFKKSQVVKEQEIYACMLHGLFDEYRFLHKYPQQYLEKIAKLFGAIIKNKLLDNILQDIALKFVLEAFRRDGKRQSFGIIVVKEIFDCLPEFPKQFQDIYTIRDKIMVKDRDLYERLGTLYAQTMASRGDGADISDDAAPQPAGGAVSSGFLSAENISAISDGESHTSMFSLTEKDLEESKKNEVTIQPSKNSTKEKGHKGNVLESESSSAGTGNLFQSQPFKPNFNNNQGKNNSNSGSQQNASQARKQSPPVQQRETQEHQVKSGQQPPFVPTQIYKLPQTSSNNAAAQAAQDKSDVPVTTGSLNVASSAFTLTPDTIAPPQTSAQLPEKTVVKTPAAPFQTQTLPPAAATQPPVAIPINVNAKTFMPTGPGSVSPDATVAPQAFAQGKLEAAPAALARPSAPKSTFNEHWVIQQAIDTKIEECKYQKGKLGLQDLLEDTQAALPTQEAQEQIKFICNHTGKNNFKAKLDDLKELVLVKPAKTAGLEETKISEMKKSAELNLNWFINYTLTKRITGQNQTLHPIYIELIKQIGSKDTISRTIKQAVAIFQRCMLIDEEEFNKVCVRPTASQNQQQYVPNLIKQYLSTLGQFIGSLTLASSRPILSKELDMKQLLLQGFAHDNRKLVITFVCRILKEAHRSQIFKVSNPWVNGLLQILREIYEICQQPNLQNASEEIKMEIELLFKTLSVKNLHDIMSSGTLKASQSNQFVSVIQQVELNYLSRKAPLIPVRVRPQRALNQFTGIAQYGSDAAAFQGEEFEEQSAQDLEHLSNITRLQPNISLQPQSIQKLTSKFNLTDAQVRQVLSEAVDASITDILPPVVDRSVTIALITTRQLVLKDFAFDGNVQKVSSAANQIVQNLAGSLALVTCREPLRISLTNHLMDAIKQACFSAGPVPGVFKTDSQDDSDKPVLNDKNLNLYIKNQEDILQEIAQVAGKENLELGCNLIQTAVIKRALKKVRQDAIMNQALERRKQTAEAGQTHYRDEEMISRLSDLPPMLQPNKDGLTDAQIQVYSDFSRLSNTRSTGATETRLNQASLATLPGEIPAQFNIGGAQSSQSGAAAGLDQQISNTRLYEPAIYEFTLDSIFNEIEKTGHLTSVTRSLLTLKLAELSKPLSSNTEGYTKNQLQESRYRLWSYAENKMVTICQSFDSFPNDLTPTIQILSMIVNKYKGEDFGKRLLGESFLQMEEMYFLNVDLNILLMRNNIIQVAEWDKQLALFIQDSPGQLQENELRFLAQFIDQSIFKQKFLSQDKIPNLIKVLEKLESSPGTDQQTLNLKRCFGNSLVKLRKEQPTAQEKTLRAHYYKWVELSYIDDTAAQEKEVNSYFSDFETLKIVKDQETLFNFCNVMIKVSIEFALYTRHGEKRTNNKTLDYRFIDSFIKLVVVMLKMFDFNKHEFMSKIFEFIKQKLDEDHSTQQRQFNQKPYYRMLMNILTAINMSDCFTQKTQKQILFDLADLLQDLNPNKYPAFAFAWLELISHRLFMPHFIKKAPTAAGGQGRDATVQGAGQSTSQGGAPAGSQSQEKQPAQQTRESQADSNAQNQKWFKIKDLIVSCFLFLKQNMTPGKKTSPAMQSFYTATMRIVLVILLDYPEFLCDFHFNFVNSLPDHAIQLKNMVLAAHPRHINPRSPLAKDLKVDMISEDPLILSNYEAYLKMGNLREDLESYFKTKKPALITEICNKMMSAKEKINDKEIPRSTVINAVVLYIATQTCGERRNNSDLAQNENLELFKQMALKLDDETRLCLLNSIVNELRYPNSHTFFLSVTLLFLFCESKPIVQQQIATILFERLQSVLPFPWGLMINFRELIQNAKYGFMTSPFISQNHVAINFLFENKLRDFMQFINQQFIHQQQRQSQQVAHPSAANASQYVGQHQMQQQFHGMAAQSQDLNDLSHRAAHPQGAMTHPSDSGVHQHPHF